MPGDNEGSASAGSSRPDADKLKTPGLRAAGTAAAPTPSPQRPRHHFTRSLSELSAPLRLRRHSQSQAQGQNQSRRNPAGRDNRDNSDGRGLSTQANAAPAVTATGSSALAPISPSLSPRLSPLAKSTTAGTTGTSFTSATTTTSSSTIPDGYRSLNDPSGLSPNRAASVAASPDSSRRPSVRNSKDYPDEYRQHQTQQQDHQQQSQHNHLHRHHHHHHHHHNSHSTTIAALTAAATAVAAATPTPAPTLPNPLTQAPTNVAGTGAEADRPREEQQQQQERQASIASGAALPSVPIDPAAVRAAAATLQRMQREQSRNAARVLQSAVTDLDGLSTATSQRLDAAYGSVLARVSALQDTVLALRSLASAARATNRRFATEAEAITHEVDQQVLQLEGSGRDGVTVLTPADQQRRLEELSDRVHHGREAIQSLSERVDAVRGRVELWERADRAWQERTRTRLKVLWVIVSSIVLTLLVLLCVLVQSSGAATRVNDGDLEENGSGANGSSILPDFSLDKPLPAASSESNFPDLAAASPPAKFHLSFPNSSADGDGGDASPNGEQDDPLRRLFDEL